MWFYWCCVNHELTEATCQHHLDLTALISDADIPGCRNEKAPEMLPGLGTTNKN